MKQPPAITVLLPVYNSARFLAETIRSILEQSFSGFELLIIDDLSTDGSREVIRSFNDDRIRSIFHERNVGLNATLNEGLDLARGAYTARMDGDDLMHPRRLEIQKRFLDENPGVAVVASTVELMNTDDEVTGVWDTDQATITEEEIRKMMPRTNCIAHPSVMIRMSALGTERYSLTQKGTEDWDLWLRLLGRGMRVAKIKEPLLRYRIHPASMTGIARRKAPLEARLLRARSRYLLDQWRSGHFNGYHAALAHAQARTLARHLLNTTRRGARSIKRALTYSPFELTRETRALERTLAEWKGRHVLLFPHMRMGGAELVHARIAATIADEDPLIIIHGFSKDRTLQTHFDSAGTVLRLPHLLNHPLTHGPAVERIAARLRQIKAPVLFGSLSGIFFDLIPHLPEDARVIHLQHAFLHQPGANLQHKAWLDHFPRVNDYVFIAEHALEEFKKFLFANNIPRSSFHKLRLIPNAVERFGPPRRHDRIGLLFVARESPEKRLEIFLDLARELHRSHPGVFRYTVVGPSPRTNAGPVEFAGRIDDRDELYRIYGGHDILLLTSYREGFPMVIMEAMAMGLMVLSTPVGDVPRRLSSEEAIVTSDVNGDNVRREMVEALISLAQDRERLERMRMAAYRKALAEFGQEAFTGAYRALLIP